MSRWQGIILALSIGLHVAVLAALRVREEPRKKAVAEAIRVRVVPQKAPEPAPQPITQGPAAKGKQSAGERKSQGKGKGQTKGKAPGSVVAGPPVRGYGRYLPGPGDVLSARAYGGAGGGNDPRATPAQIAGARDVAATFDVPLAFRTGHPGSQAVAVVRSTTDNRHGWRFETLDGEPVLRAALFEALITPATRRKIPELMRSLGYEELMVVLRIVLEQDSARDPVDANQVSIEGRKLVIAYSVYRTSEGIRAVPPGAQPPVEGMPIPDEHSRRAELRDQVHRKRLQLSPAFHAPLRRRDPE